MIIEVRPGGGRACVSEIPGKIPGSKAIYRKEVDDSGNTKTTIDPSANVVHVKDKFPGEGGGTGSNQGV